VSDLWGHLLNHSQYSKELNDLFHIGSLIWRRGWAEANAGNVSLRLPKEIITELKSLLSELLVSHSLVSPGTADDFYWFLVSVSGSRYRDYEFSGPVNFVITAVPKTNEDNKNGITTLHFLEGINPTSEWPIHSSVQIQLAESCRSERVILHAHPTDWIVIGNLDEYDTDCIGLAEKITSALPELEIYLPGRIALLSQAAPGSDKLAEMTLKGFKETKALVWQKHGIILIGDTVYEAFDLMEIVAKAAEVFLKNRQAVRQ
jgi:rhamnulose-1-phosphate aldolase